MRIFNKSKQRGGPSRMLNTRLADHLNKNLHNDFTMDEQ